MVIIPQDTVNSDTSREIDSLPKSCLRRKDYFLKGKLSRENLWWALGDSSRTFIREERVDSGGAAAVGFIS
jgi:hypothetical protein